MQCAGSPSRTRRRRTRIRGTARRRAAPRTKRRFNFSPARPVRHWHKQPAAPDSPPTRSFSSACSAHHPVVEQQRRLVLALLPRVGYRPGSRWPGSPRRIPAREPAPGPGIPAREPRATKGLRRSTWTVGLHRILRGSARVWALGLGQAVTVKGPSRRGRGLRRRRRRAAPWSAACHGRRGPRRVLPYFACSAASSSRTRRLHGTHLLRGIISLSCEMSKSPDTYSKPTRVDSEFKYPSIRL